MVSKFRPGCCCEVGPRRVRPIARVLVAAFALAVAATSCWTASPGRSGSPASNSPSPAIPPPTASEPSTPPLTNEMTTDEAIAWATAKSIDCNGNAIPDSIDLARGYAQDEDHDGTIDLCFADSAIAESQDNKLWQIKTDSSYFAVIHLFDRTILIRYTVPSDDAHVRLVLSGPPRVADTLLVNSYLPSGPYLLHWNRELRGRPAPPGEYTFTLWVGTRRYIRRMAWAN